MRVKFLYLLIVLTILIGIYATEQHVSAEPKKTLTVVTECNGNSIKVKVTHESVRSPISVRLITENGHTAERLWPPNKEFFINNFKQYARIAVDVSDYETLERGLTCDKVKSPSTKSVPVKKADMDKKVNHDKTKVMKSKKAELAAFLPSKEGTSKWDVKKDDNGVRVFFKRDGIDSMASITKYDPILPKFWTFSERKKLTEYKVPNIPIECLEYSYLLSRDPNVTTVAIECYWKDSDIFVRTFDQSTDVSLTTNRLYINEILSNLNSYYSIEPKKVDIVQYKINSSLEQSPIPQQSQKKQEGFSNTACKQDKYGYVKMTGKFTNGPIPYSSIYFKMAVIGYNGDVLATGIGSINNVGSYQTKIFDASTKWKGSYSSCEIEFDTAYK